MAVVITDECSACGACAEGCPASAIEQGDPKYKITDACTECLACIETCPTGAIVQQ